MAAKAAAMVAMQQQQQRQQCHSRQCHGRWGSTIKGGAIIGSARWLRMSAADGDESAMVALFYRLCDGSEHD